MEMKTNSHMNISAPLWKCRRALVVGFDACQRLKDGVREAPASVFTAVNDLYYASVIFTVIIIITPACAIHFSVSPPGPRALALDSRTKHASMIQSQSVFLYSLCQPFLSLQSEITADDEIDTFETDRSHL